MKKLLKFVLAIAMSATMMSMTVFAAGSGSMDVESKTAQAGQAVSIDVSITGNPGVAALIVEPEYDPNVLTLDSITGSGLNWTTGNAASWSDAANTTYTGKILTLNFTVNGNASLGTTSVSVKVDAANYDEELVAFSVSAGTVTIECNHVYDQGSVTTPATCEGTGVMTYTCTLGCGDSYTADIPATGHAYGEWGVTKEATCTEAGTESRVCANDNTHVDTREIAATGHDFQWVVDKEATTEEDGIKHEECTVCHEKRNEGTVIPKIVVEDVHQHFYGTIGMDETYHWVFCSCGDIENKNPHNFVDAGNGILRCPDCGYEVAKTATTPATGDSSNLTLWFVLMAIAAGAVFVVAYNKKRSM